MQTKWKIKPGSIRFQFFSFLGALLLILLLLLNIYPYVSARDAVYQEKHRAMESQGSTLSSAIAGLDRPDRESISEILRLLDMQGYDRLTVYDVSGIQVYDHRAGSGQSIPGEDIGLALSGKSVFRSALLEDGFSTSYIIPVSSKGVITGALYLHETDAERGKIIADLQSQIRTVSFVISIATLVVAGLYSTVVIRKIQNLGESMRIVGRGDYSHRMTTKGKDELSELGNEFNKLTERLDDTERQRRRFVSDASHELKTPLASIRLLSDSIVQNEGMDMETVREFVTDIGSEAERLQRTTEKLLDLSRLDDDVHVMPEPVDVKQVAVDALVLLRPLADERGVRIRCELEEGCVIMATVDDVFHIIFNLMENAIKYNVPEGSVLLSLSGTEESVHFTVTDTGIGIPAADLPHIFDRFYRVDKARSRATGGTGLGLSIVKQTVVQHGGNINAASTEGKGTTFEIELPLPQ